MKKKSLKIKVCPFCGNTPSNYTFKDESNFSHSIVDKYVIDCSECDIRMSSEDEEELLANWNLRKGK